MNNIMRNLLMRRSIYTFDEREVQDVDIQDILAEGKELSRAEDNEVWHFTVLKNKKLLNEIRGIINDEWRARFGLGAQVFSEVPLLLVISGRSGNSCAMDAANMVFSSMMLVAQKCGLSACWLSDAAQLFSSDRGKEAFGKIGVPSDYRPLCVGVFGYKPGAFRENLGLSDDKVTNIVK